MFSQVDDGSTKIKSEVLDTISYEVKESLTSIIGFSNIIKNSCSDSKQSEQINKVLISSEKLLEFANNISDFSKLIAGKYETNCYTFSTEKLLNEIVNSFESIARMKGIDLKSNISEVKIKNDYQMTSQIVYGLMNYLIKLSFEGSFIFIQNIVTTKGVLIEIESDIKNFTTQKITPNLNEILQSEDSCCENLEFYLTNHLITLLEGQILCSELENNSIKIQLYIPNKIA
ncbi:MAG: histidine kinase dimerization/phospho-acceptor domain-containing protein [bacterium]